MGKLDLRDIFSVSDEYDVLLFDLWGVVVEGSYIYPGVVDNINKIIAQNKKIFFVSNAPRSTSSLLKRVQSWGLRATQDMVMSSGAVAIDFIKDSKVRFDISRPVIYHLFFDDNDLLDHLDYHQTKDISEANILLLTLYLDDYEGLDLDQFDEILAYAVQNKIVSICANPDIGIMQRGVQRYCAGYFAKKIEQMGGNVIYTGKPGVEIYNNVFAKLPDNFDRSRILMIGDTFYTDVLGANNVGIHSALVMTGNAEKYHAAYDDIDEKLRHLKIAATEEGVTPNFAIKLT